MVEAGKRFQARGLIREIEQLVRFGYVSHVGIRLATWGIEVVPYEWNPDDEVPEQILACSEGSNVEALSRFIRAKKDDKFIILSDCHWSLESKEAMNSATEIWRTDSVRIVALGADARITLNDFVAIPCHESLVLIEEWLAQ